MKRFFIYGLAILALAACGGNGGNNNKSAQGTGKKFAPQERTSSKSAAEREAAIAEKKAGLEVDYESLLSSHGVKLSIIQPIIAGDITVNVADRISMKMLEMAAQNGISSLGDNPNFVLGAEVNQTGRATTGTAPQKMTVKYELVFKVISTFTGDVFGVAKQEVMGVGNSFEEASINAVNEIKNTPEIQAFLSTASNRIVEWYDNNVSVIRNQVEEAQAEGNYALALAILNSVPEQAKVAYAYVSEQQPKTLEAMLHKQATDMLGEMESLLASSGDQFNPAVGAYFSLIPADTPEHKKAQALYAEYEKKCNARRASLEAKAERDEQAARELEKLKMLYEHKEELAQKEVDKVMHQAEAQASSAKYAAEAKAAAAASRARPTGLFSSLGYAITTVTDKIFNN